MESDLVAYWNDQWWAGSNVTVHSATVVDNAITFDYEYTEGSSTDWGMQVFYKNSQLVQGTEYTLKLTVTVEDACSIKINNSVHTLVAGENTIEVTYTEGDISSLDMQIDKSDDYRNTITFSNISWSYYE